MHCFEIYCPTPSKGIKFQPLGLFLVAQISPPWSFQGIQHRHTLAAEADIR